VLNGVPVPTSVPTVAAVYQSMVVPAGAVADMVTDPVPHLEPLTGEVAAPGLGFTVAITATLEEAKQPVVVLRACA